MMGYETLCSQQLCKHIAAAYLTKIMLLVSYEQAYWLLALKVVLLYKTSSLL